MGTRPKVFYICETEFRTWYWNIDRMESESGPALSALSMIERRWRKYSEASCCLLELNSEWPLPTRLLNMLRRSPFWPCRVRERERKFDLPILPQLTFGLFSTTSPVESSIGSASGECCPDNSPTDNLHLKWNESIGMATWENFLEFGPSASTGRVCYSD